jgi:hypothetical protein
MVIKVAYHGIQDIIDDTDYKWDFILGFHVNVGGQLDAVTANGDSISIEVLQGVYYPYALREVLSTSTAEIVRLVP